MNSSLKHHWVLMLVTLLWLLSATVSANTASPPLLVQTDNASFSLASHVDGYIDETGELGFPEIKQVDFVPVDIRRSAGYSAATHWFRFQIGRATDVPREWILVMGESYLDTVDVWVQQADGHITPYHLGDHADYAGRPISLRQFAIPLALTDAPVTVYVRVQSISIINFKASVWQSTALMAQETRTYLFHGIFFGILIIVVVLYLLLGLMLKDGSMLLYSAYVLSLLCMYLGINGYIPLLFSPSYPWVNDLVTGVGIIGGLSTFVLFWVLLLKLNQTLPWVGRIYTSIGLLCMCSLPFVAMPIYRLIAHWIHQITPLAAISILIVIIWLWLKQRRAELLLYFFAFIATLVGVLLTALTSMGWIAYHPLTANAYEHATLIHVLILSLGLGLRLRQIQRDKATAEQEIAVSTQRAQEQRRFVAMLSHEFRNPLTVIDRSAQMIQFKTPDLAKAEVDRLQHIREKATALGGLVNNFLVSESLDNKVLSVESASIPSLLHNVLKLVGESDAKRLSISVSPDNAQFPLDKNLMEMAVGNLVNNALRYSSPTSPVILSATVDNGGLTIQVKDNGPGLSEEELDMLGQPYYRTNTSLGKKGSGLGLYFTRRVVDALNGKLQAHSGPDKGLSVTIVLPWPGNMILTRRQYR